MKSRHIFTGILLALTVMCGSPLAAQDGAEGLFQDRAPVFPATPYLSLDIGSRFMTAGPAGNMFTNTIAPRLNWDVSNDLQLNIGTIFTSARSGTMQGMLLLDQPMAGGEQILPGTGGHFFSTTVYAFGTYQVSPRLSLTGGTWVERTNYDLQDTPFNQQGFQQNPRGMMLGLDYKVSENVRFGAEVGFSKGFDPYAPVNFHQSPFGGYHNPMPFYRRGRW